MQQQKSATVDRVRVAYGAVPVILEKLPSDFPLRAKLRDEARQLLRQQGLLTEAELDSLPITEAIRLVLQRVHDRSSRPGP
jgi:hypothetical protein